VTLRFSILLNIALLLLLLIAGVFILWREWLFVSYRDGRPQGPLLTLQHESPVAGPGVTFFLPKGTVLQESTPHGAATLGKSDGREFILILHTDDESFIPYSQEEDLGWMVPYRFRAIK